MISTTYSIPGLGEVSVSCIVDSLNYSLNTDHSNITDNSCVARWPNCRSFRSAYVFRWVAYSGRQKPRVSGRGELFVHRYRTSRYGRRSFSVAAPSLWNLWNSLPVDIRQLSGNSETIQEENWRQSCFCNIQQRLCGSISLRALYKCPLLLLLLLLPWFHQGKQSTPAYHSDSSWSCPWQWRWLLPLSCLWDPDLSASSTTMHEDLSQPRGHL